MTKVSGLLAKRDKNWLIELIIKYKDCFPWDYHEMPRLLRELVEHRLPIREEVKSHRQTPRRCNS